MSVTALEDKIVQTAVGQVLNAIYEQNLLGLSYGFRPGRGQHDALDALSVGIQNFRVRWILDVDIRAFFDTIDHEWMMCFLQHRIADRRMLGLIARWLRTGVIENGKRIPAKQGTPKGAPISPLLANIYLHYVTDLWIRQWRGRTAQGEIVAVRYADDIVLGFEKREDAWSFRHALEARLAQFYLTLHPEKTRLLRFGWFAAEDCKKRGEGKPETFDFLEFTHFCSQTKNGMFVVGRTTISKRMRAMLKEIRAQLHKRRHEPVPVIGQWLSQLFRGYCNYYHVPGNTRRLDAFRREIIGAWRYALKRRSQRHRLNWERVTALARLFIPYPRELPMHPDPITRFGVKPKAGAVCDNSARTDLCGGWQVTAIPTATLYAVLSADIEEKAFYYAATSNMSGNSRIHVELDNAQSVTCLCCGMGMFIRELEYMGGCFSLISISVLRGSAGRRCMMLPLNKWCMSKRMGPARR
ncbi:reverse transcriptase domain-containing protein [Pseudomonas sp. Q1]|uniref:reverse transcriptase domain-containing protein n=1 Tax=Pseudomonas sp. Q1 TaxID=2202823 RepID=UPI003558F25E